MAERGCGHFAIFDPLANFAARGKDQSKRVSTSSSLSLTVVAEVSRFVDFLTAHTPTAAHGDYFGAKVR
jgi:hypothetical protein